MEFILKLYAEPKDYWKSYYNLFDFTVLFISYFEITIHSFLTHEKHVNIEGLKILRAFRTLRTLRTISFIKGLQILVKALVDTIHRWLINIILLLLLLMYMFGVMGYYFFGTGDHADTKNWGSMSKAMLSLFTFVSADGWTDIQESMDEKGYKFSRLFTIVFIFIGNFIFTNVFIGVIIMSINQSTETYKVIVYFLDFC